MELLLVALGGCTASGVGLLLRKKGRVVTAVKAQVTGDRAETHPTVFRSIDLELEVTSPDATEEELDAVLLAAETTICPVYIMLSQATTIRARARLTGLSPAH
jgi:putative redox protein